MEICIKDHVHTLSLHTLARTHTHTRTQSNKYCLPILCHSTPRREASIDRQHSFAWSIVSFSTSLFLSQCLAPHTSCTHLSCLFCLWSSSWITYHLEAPSQKPQAPWSISFGFILDQLPSISNVGLWWEGRRVGSFTFDYISQIFSMAKCTVPHSWFAQPATVSSSIMCCWEKAKGSHETI